jgi:hypothetical protein
VGPARRPHCLLLLSSQCSTAPHRTRRAAAARTDGTAGPPSWHARRARARTLDPLQGFCEWKLPLLPLPVTLKGGKPPLVVGHDAALGKSSNGSPVRRSFPLRCFDQALITQGRAPCAS